MFAIIQAAKRTLKVIIKSIYSQTEMSMKYNTPFPLDYKSSKDKAYKYYSK